MIDEQKIRNIYESILMSDLYDMISISDTKMTSDEANVLATKHFDSPFLPKNVKKYIKGCDKMIRIKSDEATLHVYQNTSNIKDTKITMAKLVLSLKQAIVTKRFFNVERHLNIHIVLSPYKRYMPCAKEHVCETHINGGFTNPFGNDIYVFREEEYTKVMIHEILHHSREIHNNGFVERQLNELKREFNIAKDTVLIPNEAVVEFWATIANCVYMSIEYNQHFKKLLNTELGFSMYQSRKILEKQGNTPWYEKTNSYCYVIFKTILLKNISKLSGYTYPYDPEYITKFLIRYKNSVKNNAIKADLYDKIRTKKSLRMTFLAD